MKKTKIWMVIIVYICIVYLNPIIISKLNFCFTNLINSDIFTFSYLILFLVSLILFRKILSRDLKNVIDIDFEILFRQCLILFAVYLASCIVATFYLPSNMNEANIDLYQNSCFKVIIITIIGPCVEEFVFRLAMVNLFRNKFAGVLVSSIIFGMNHCIDNTIISGNVIQLAWAVPYIILGLGLGFIYEKHNNIFSSCISHCLINVIGVIGG